MTPLFIDALTRLAGEADLESIRRSLAPLLAQRTDPRLPIFLEEVLRSAGLEFVLERNDHELAVLNLGDHRQRVDRLLPGHYRLRFSTGRVLWEDDLQEDDLVSRSPDLEMQLAAATDEIESTCSREEFLAEGSVWLRVFPGYDSGIFLLESRRRIA